MKTGRKKNGVSYAKYGYMFAIPFVVGYLVLKLYPLVHTLVLSFTDHEGFGSTSYNFVGFANYIRILGLKQYWRSFGNTLIEWAGNVFIQFPLALLLVYSFTNKRMNIRGQDFWRTVFYLPAIVSSGALAMLFCMMFVFPNGMVNQLLKNLGLIEKDINFIQNWKFDRYLVIYLELFKSYGGCMLMLLASAKSVDAELFDAAAIDGAGSIKRFFYITIPGIRHVLMYLMIGAVAGGLQLYDTPAMISSDVNVGTVAMFIRSQAFGSQARYNLAAAGSFVLFLIILPINLFIMQMFHANKEGGVQL